MVRLGNIRRDSRTLATVSQSCVRWLNLARISIMLVFGRIRRSCPALASLLLVFQDVVNDHLPFQIAINSRRCLRLLARGQNNISGDGGWGRNGFPTSARCWTLTSHAKHCTTVAWWTKRILSLQISCRARTIPGRTSDSHPTTDLVFAESEIQSQSMVERPATCGHTLCCTLEIK